MAKVTNPYYGTGQDPKSWAWEAYMKFFGRAPTEAEVAAVAPVYIGGDKNIGNVAGGDAYVAQLSQIEKNSPDKLYKNKQAELAKLAPEKYGDVEGIYQELLKRGASQSELDHFGKMLASGEVDPYELRSFITSQEEYRTGKDKEFREGLAGELGEYDKEIFDREKENVISRYAQMGRSGSSSLDFALTDLMGKIGQERSKYLAQVSAAQYEGNKGAAREDYRTNLDRLFQREDYGQARTDQLEDFMRNRSFEIQDYNREAEDYARYMSRRKGNAGANAFSGAAGGAAMGGAVGGPWGAGIGAVGGGLFGYFNS